MVTTSKGHEVELKRRLFILSLNMKPRDLRSLLGVPKPAVSFLLRGERRLTREELEKVTPLVLERLEALFC
ncbi:MAG: hypothetical protein V3T60_16645 [Candidatus Binatia bacterium]